MQKSIGTYDNPQPKISVISPSVRPEGLALVNKALRRQTFTDFEWLVVSPQDYGFGKWVKEPPKNGGDYWGLNKAMNEAIRQAKGELVVSWQDWTYAKPNALEKFWQHYSLDHKKIVSGVGNKYQDESWSVVVWQDPRIRSDYGTFYPCFFNDIEFNFCALPLNAFYAVGGYDEYLDKMAGMDGYSVVERLNLLNDGWDFYLDQANESFSLEHGRLSKDWDEKNWLPRWDKEVRPRYVANPILGYLTI